MTFIFDVIDIIFGEGGEIVTEDFTAVFFWEGDIRVMLVDKI